MDLSAIIFVALAVAWAVYLIPKALKHHDELASDRLVEGHSDRVRILSRRSRTVVEEIAEVVPEPAPEPTPVTVVSPSPISRATARKAAQRRRRVLGVLVLALVAVWALTWLAYLPIWAPAVPGLLVVGWLVIARLSVRKQQRRRVSRPVELTEPAGSFEVAAPSERFPSSNADEFLDQLADEDTAGLAREDIEAALADEGSLWDPLPMTLPTYVNKARARRTVRTIELTGLTSSGHDVSDTAIAREAAEKAESAKQSGAGQRRVAGA